uniref:Uncharacterized protein n=1 Tax=Anguilla anguilla TaxID=7936 RepID=A0A0E9X343_ANGAN
MVLFTYFCVFLTFFKGHHFSSELLLMESMPCSVTRLAHILVYVEYLDLLNILRGMF